MHIDEHGTWYLTRREAGALMAHASTDTARTNLMPVWLDCEMHRAFTTDGHRAIVALCGSLAVEKWDRIRMGTPDGIAAVDLARAVKQARKNDTIAITPLRPSSAYRGGTPVGPVTAWTLTVWTAPRLNRKEGEDALTWIPKLATATESDDGETRTAIDGRSSSVRYRERDIAAVCAIAPPIANIAPTYDRQPPAETPAVIGLDACYLSDISWLADVTEDRRAATIHLGASPLDPVLATTTASDGTEWRYILMPVRLDYTPRRRLAA